MNAIEKVKKAEGAYRRASQKANELCAKRNAAVLDALGERIRPTDIAVSTGLSKSRISQIRREGAKT